MKKFKQKIKMIWRILTIRNIIQISFNYSKVNETLIVDRRTDYKDKVDIDIIDSVAKALKEKY